MNKSLKQQQQHSSSSISCILRLILTCKVLPGSIFKADCMTLQMPVFFHPNANTKYIFKTKHLSIISKEMHMGCRTIRRCRLHTTSAVHLSSLLTNAQSTPCCVHTEHVREHAGKPEYANIRLAHTYLPQSQHSERPAEKSELQLQGEGEKAEAIPLISLSGRRGSEALTLPTGSHCPWQTSAHP